MLTSTPAAQSTATLLVAAVKRSTGHDVTLFVLLANAARGKRGDFRGNMDCPVCTWTFPDGSRVEMAEDTGGPDTLTALTVL